MYDIDVIRWCSMLLIVFKFVSSGSRKAYHQRQKARPENLASQDHQI
jgi:hypothetical protein